MNKKCVFNVLQDEGQRYCTFKQKKAAGVSCFLCTTSYEKHKDLDIKDHFTIANTNKNFKLQLFLSTAAILISIIITVDKIFVTKNLNDLLKAQNEKIEKLENNQKTINDKLKLTLISKK